jgi:hypothetical protein
MLSANSIDPTTPTLPAKSDRTKALTARIAEIKAIDKSDLSISEKRDLRKQSNSLKKERRNLNNGVYISGAGLLLLVVLLIILL